MKYTITFDIDAGKYRMMRLNDPHPRRGHTNRYRINGKIFIPVMVYDLPGTFAIESKKSHLGQTFEFIWVDPVTGEVEEKQDG